MSTRTWTGGAATVAQVDKLTPGGTIEIGDKFKVTMTDESGTSSTLSVAATGTTVAQTVADIVAAFNLSTDPRFAAATAANATTYASLTADTAGTPFVCTVTTTESDDSAADLQTFTQSTSTPNSGPYDWNCAANWLEKTVPVAGDHVVIDGVKSIRYGLNQASVTLGKVCVEPSYSGNIGSGVGAPLRFACGSPMMVDGAGTHYINVGSSNIDVHVAGTAEDADNDHSPGLFLFGSNIANLYVHDGRVELPWNAGVTSTVATAQNSGGRLVLGPGTTATTVNSGAGETYLYCAATTVNADGGTTWTRGTGAITTFNVSGKATVVYPNSTGTITLLTVKSGEVDFTTSRASRAVTTARIDGGSVMATAGVTVGTLTDSTDGFELIG